MMCSRFMRTKSEAHGRIYRAIEAGFEIASGYRRTLTSWASPAITLKVFFCYPRPHGRAGPPIPPRSPRIFRTQDRSSRGLSEDAPGRVARRNGPCATGAREVLLSDPGRRGLRLEDRRRGANAPNTGRFFIVSAARRGGKASCQTDHRPVRPDARQIQGREPVHLQQSQEITIGGSRLARHQFNTSCKVDTWRARGFSQTCWNDEGLAGVADVSSDLRANARSSR